MNQCTHCTIMGNFEHCIKTDCFQHESWYAKQLNEQIAEMTNSYSELEQENKTLRDRNDELTASLFGAADWLEGCAEYELNCAGEKYRAIAQNKEL